MTDKELFILENAEEWKATGEQHKQIREKLGLTLAAMAKTLGTSASRLSRFEKGLPVQSVNQLIKGYKLLHDYLTLMKAIGDLAKSEEGEQ